MSKIRVETNLGVTTLKLTEMFMGSMEYYSRKALVIGTLHEDGVRLFGYAGVKIIRVLESDVKISSMHDGRELMECEPVTKRKHAAIIAALAKR